MLCSDKTGTITEGTMHLQAMVGVEGRDSKKVALYAYLNASFETGFTNPIDRPSAPRPPATSPATRNWMKCRMTLSANV